MTGAEIAARPKLLSKLGGDLDRSIIFQVRRRDSKVPFHQENSHCLIPLRHGSAVTWTTTATTECIISAAIPSPQHSHFLVRQ